MFEKVTLVAIVALLGFLYYNVGEGYIAPRSYRVEKVLAKPSPHGNGVTFFQTPHFQSRLSPRFSNVDYGPHLRAQKFTNYSAMGVPEEPIPVSEQPVVYDRYIYSNKKSRLRGRGDPIRGDLPITPMTGNWFVPATHPEHDLRQGAMGVMSGIHNETGNATDALIASYTNSESPLEYASSSNQYRTHVNNGAGDVTVTGFP